MTSAPALTDDQRSAFLKRWTEDDSGCLLWTGHRLPDGYGTHTIWVGGRSQSFRAHRLMWLLNVGPIPDGVFVLHDCDTPACGRHLRLGDHAANMRDRSARNRQIRWERINTAKLTRRQVVQIREIYSNGGVSQRDLARRFGVAQSSIGAIVREESWRGLCA